MLWSLLTQEEKNLILLKVLVYLSVADGEIQIAEFSYLATICRSLNIDPERIRDYVRIENQQLREILPVDEEDRMNFLYHALFMMNADKKVDYDEEIFVFKLGFKLGFSEEMVREFIELMKQHSLDDVPREAMLNIIRKHNN
ncbi:MAG: hypothetical protein LC107_07730 [Chitinophagales bacterium]|nr:hypothetical protein [Chitinophagales bacterium]